MLAEILKSFKIQTVFIYVTEKCNLDCAYCYFKHKKGRDLDRTVLGTFLDRLVREGLSPQQFEISGGEPLLCWEMLKAAVRKVECDFPGKRIGLQTNGLLLTGDRIRFIKKHRLFLEIGIDGNMCTTSRWRKKMSEAGFQRLLSNIRRCVQEGVPVGCNMTVHPKEAGGIIQNFDFLRSLGIRSIDITPAAFMRWNEESRAIFKERYEELLGSRDNGKWIYLREDTRFFSQPFLDVSLHPPGHVLCGDAFLCLPEKQKQRYSLWDHRTGGIRPETVRFFIKAYEAARKKLKRAYTHRDYICSSFQIVNSLAGKKYLNTAEMVPLLRFLTRAHLSIR